MDAWYFAFGSNMDWDEFCLRLNRDPSVAWERHAGLLTDHRLSFSKRSSLNPRVGYATVDPAPGATVEGVLYRMTLTELEALDAIELVPHHYRRTTLSVALRDAAETVAAECYVAEPAWVTPGLYPTERYIARMLRAGDLISPGYAATLASYDTQTEKGYAPVA